MKTKLLLLFILIAIHTTVIGQTNGLDKEQIQAIKQLINIVKSKNKIDIADFIDYPLRREYPLKDVKDKNDLVMRFDEIFDNKLIEQISKSKIDDWAEVGWRGIMLGNGTLWIDDDGKIVAINHQTFKEKQLLVNKIEKDKKDLPKSLQNFKRPMYLILTKNYKIRIDEQLNGSYRYTAWKNMTKRIEPDLIIEDGVLEYLGSGGNHTITFKNNGYTYLISINQIGANDEADTLLEVSKDGKTILTENGVIKRN